MPLPVLPPRLRAPDWMVRGHSFAHDTRCAGGGEPAHVQPDLGEDRPARRRGRCRGSRRAGRRRAAPARPGRCRRRGPVVPSASTPWAAGIAAISSSIRVVSVSIWAVRASIWSSSIRASSAWWSSNRPVERLDQGGALGLHPAAGQVGEHAAGRVPRRSAPRSCPAPTACPASLATADTLISASSSSFSSRCQYRVRSRVRSTRSRV